MGDNEKIKISNKRFINGCEFARLLGVRRQTIYARASRGGLVRRPDGKFDLASEVNQDYIKQRLERLNQINQQTRLDGEAATVVAREEAAKREAVKTEAADLVSRADTDNEFIEIAETEDGFISKNEAERLKTLESVQKLRIENLKNRYKLIDRQLVKTVFAKLYSIDVNGFRTLAPRISARIAAIAGLEESSKILNIEETINSEVFEILKQVKLTVNRFLLGIKDNFEMEDEDVAC